MKPKFAIYDADGAVVMLVQGSPEMAQANTPAGGVFIEIDPSLSRTEEIPPRPASGV